MENVKHCAVLVRRAQDVWEGTRAALGLAAHNYGGYLFVLNVTIEMTDALKDNLEWLEELECPYYTNVEENAQWGFQHMPIEQIASELKKMDLVIPFGDRQ